MLRRKRADLEPCVWWFTVGVCARISHPEKSHTMIVAVKNTFFVGKQAIRSGSCYDDGHELVKRYPEHFEPVPVAGPDPRRSVETATAAPGEKRAAKRAPMRSSKDKD